MADGVTIQRASREALAQGVSLRWILSELDAMPRLTVPIILMSYLNPLLALGLGSLCRLAAGAGVCGFIVPDLPLDESAEFKQALEPYGLALIQMVTPVTRAARMALVCAQSQGFVYAVTMTGTTGKSVEVPQAVLDHLDQVRELATIPVCAGFGIRSREQVSRLAPHVDGVIVGSALVEVLESDADPAAWLGTLRSGRR
jgi:tryptophan synthase alpha chain